jgi:hypothetical protein
MEHLSLGMEQRQQQLHMQWRRDKVQELSSKGQSQREVASILKMGIGTINRDLSYLRQQARLNIKKYIDERLPEEYEKCLIGLASILKEAWSTAIGTTEKQGEAISLSLAKECYAMKLDLLTNAMIVDDVIKFVRQQQKPLSSVDTVSNGSKENKEDKEKSKIPEYEEKI